MDSPASSLHLHSKGEAAVRPTFLYFSLADISFTYLPAYFMFFFLFTYAFFPFLFIYYFTILNYSYRFPILDIFRYSLYFMLFQYHSSYLLCLLCFIFYLPAFLLYTFVFNFSFHIFYSYSVFSILFSH